MMVKQCIRFVCNMMHPSLRLYSLFLAYAKNNMRCEYTVPYILHLMEDSVDEESKMDEFVFIHMPGSRQLQ